MIITGGMKPNTRERGRAALATVTGGGAVKGDTPTQQEAADRLQQLQVDAERYRFIRRKFAIVGDEFVAINLPRPVYLAPDPAYELDAVIDQAIRKEGAP